MNILFMLLAVVNIVGGNREVLINDFPTNIELVADIHNLENYKVIWSIKGPVGTGLSYLNERAVISFNKPATVLVQVVVSNGKEITSDAVYITVRSR